MSGGQDQHYALHPVPKQPFVKVDQQAETASCSFQVGKNLGLMNWQQMFGCFQLNDQGTFDKKVGSAFTDAVSLVRHADCFLPLKRYAAQLQLDRQRFLVDTFEKSWPEYAMHFQGRTDSNSDLSRRLGVSAVQSVLAFPCRPPRPWRFKSRLSRHPGGFIWPFQAFPQRQCRRCARRFFRRHPGAAPTATRARGARAPRQTASARRCSCRSRP